MKNENRRRSFRCALVLAIGSAVALSPVAAVAAPAKPALAPSGFSGAPGPDGNAAKSDDRSDPAADERRQLNQQAIEKVLRSEAPVQTRGGSKAVQVAPGQWAEYGLEDSDQILSFLIDFGTQVDPRFPTAPAGPQHNQIPEPNRAVDNSTYWEPDFDRQHYLDMFFDPQGESLKTLYEEMSSGRYTVDGDVSDWVTVPYNSASYGETESQQDMTRFVQDAADAWYEAQIAAGKTAADIDAYLAGFDQWDRYDYNNNGNFDEPDGYIDHFQAIHAGEGEEAGAPTSTIWSHRWSVGQAGAGTQGPATNPFGGIRIGDSKVWIRDYTTEPENGGLGVFAHEYAHDLGLPDLYDTSGGENSTGFWTLMSSGSWLGHGNGTIGTTPNHMGAWEKLQLGWLDYDTAAAGTKSTHKLGPAFHATKKQQALVVTLPRDAAGNGRYYIAENRQYMGYDDTLRTGPYNFGWAVSAPDRVEHYPYQDGLLVTYWNAGQRNNNTQQHPGAGLILPVDAHPQTLRWSDGTIARNRIQSFDATFGKEATDPILLHRETATGMTTLQAPSRPGVQVFDDTNPNAYYDPANPQASVVVAGTGTKITVVNSNPKGMMTVRVN
ncbi:MULTISPECIES: immune inhibitor A domain-containing protein [unclassified Arthrobacter]|uniref:immune inhibitor A domain-containing protein n=1 Tax=unclassified Arthrobacter TaxID=235627 RepID=UPI0021083892|nr:MULTISPECIES: immune inhibitor A domain-containing protein [unclassified Arthrobacter]MCQ1987180.1 immune inhibitor A [Arthrobacter sp. zg-Y844]MCQ1995843.1 immune inhibitor A [Arthrobacter sp. zg-Y1171]UWX83077.1 immune inhibitor A [Arthrobacter sp. zg-Y1171]